MRLNLGAGSDILPGYVNHDLMALPGIDVVHDLDTFPWPWEDGSVHRIRAFDVFEHVCPGGLAVSFMTECWRILGPSGLLDLHTVHWKSPNFHRDPTHIRACDEHSFDYWVPGTYLNGRYGPAYGSGPARFEYAQPVNLVDGMELSVLLRKLA